MKIGLIVTTYNRLDYFKQCIQSLEENNYGGADFIVIVDDNSDDGTKEYLDTIDTADITISKEENKGVANSKNIGMQECLDAGCDYIFTMEDDILMTHPDTCKEYIKFGEKHKLQHMNFAHHGEMNKVQPTMVDYEVPCYPNCVGAFSMYSREVLEVIGLMDEEFKNAWEHVEHTYRICLAGYTTPFWFFADHPVSEIMLKEIEGSIDNSAIRPREDWQANIISGKAYFIKKHGTWLPPRPGQE